MPFLLFVPTNVRDLGHIFIFCNSLRYLQPLFTSPLGAWGGFLASYSTLNAQLSMFNSQCLTLNTRCSILEAQYSIIDAFSNKVIRLGLVGHWFSI